MIFRPRAASFALLCGLALQARGARTQTLANAREIENGRWDECVPFAEPRPPLLASQGLRGWVNIDDLLGGPVPDGFAYAQISRPSIRLTAEPASPPPIVVMLIGDSTVADFVSNSSWFAGWGDGIYGYFNADARVVNLAYPCYSTRWFLVSAERTKMLVVKPDYVLVQFGLIDWHGCPGYDHFTTLPEYADNLRTIVQLIRGFQGTPILMTPPVFRQFDPQGEVLPVLEDRAAVVREVAAELQTHLIDLNRLTRDLFNELGDSASAYISCDRDNAHYSPEGARVIAGLVVHALPDSLQTYLVGRRNEPPAISTIDQQVIDEGRESLLQIVAADPNLLGDGLTFSLLSAPTGATIDRVTGVFRWLPSEAQGPSTNRITVVVTDSGSPPLSDTNSFVVRVREINREPELAPIPDQQMHAQAKLTLAVHATDPDLPTNPLAFEVVAGPSGLAIDHASGLLSWEPKEPGSLGPHRVTLRVTDNNPAAMNEPALDAIRSFTVFVRELRLQAGRSIAGLTLSVETLPGRTYRLESCDTVAFPQWTPVPSHASFVSTGDALHLVLPIEADQPAYYRIALVP